MSHPITAEYPLRHQINNEVHSRPYEILAPPERITFLAALVDEHERQQVWAHAADLCSRFGQVLPRIERDHLRLDLGEFRFKLEKHEEFVRYEFVMQGGSEAPFSDPAIDHVPQDWIDAIPGKILVAAHIAVLLDEIPEDASAGLDRIIEQFGDGKLIGARIGRSGLLAFSDFTIDENGFSRFLLISDNRFPAETGRLGQRLMEVETYRMLALMGLLEARRVIDSLHDADSRLTRLTDAIARGSGKSDEELMDELSQFAAAVESLVSSSYRRFTASRAYFGVVAKRLAELKETPLPGISSFDGFLGRRLDLAKQTCDSSYEWLQQLSSRITNTTQLLRTRVDVAREAQNQQLLTAMNRRFELQLYLQLTVERLSIAIFTYYSANLIGFVAEAADKEFGWPVNTLTAKAVSIPFLILLAYAFGGRVRRAMRRAEKS